MAPEKPKQKVVLPVAITDAVSRVTRSSVYDKTRAALDKLDEETASYVGNDPIEYNFDFPADKMGEKIITRKEYQDSMRINLFLRVMWKEKRDLATEFSVGWVEKKADVVKFVKDCRDHSIDFAGNRTIQPADIYILFYADVYVLPWVRDSDPEITGDKCRVRMALDKTGRVIGYIGPITLRPSIKRLF